MAWNNWSWDVLSILQHTVCQLARLQYHVLTCLGEPEKLDLVCWQINLTGREDQQSMLKQPTVSYSNVNLVCLKPLQIKYANSKCNNKVPVNKVRQRWPLFFFFFFYFYFYVCFRLNLPCPEVDWNLKKMKSSIPQTLVCFKLMLLFKKCKHLSWKRNPLEPGPQNNTERFAPRNKDSRNPSTS